MFYLHHTLLLLQITNILILIYKLEKCLFSVKMQIECWELNDCKFTEVEFELLELK